MDQPGTPGTEGSIFELLSAYHRSLENMKAWLDQAGLDEVERLGIADAWQSEMEQFFRERGYCFGCNRKLDRCVCATGDG